MAPSLVAMPHLTFDGLINTMFVMLAVHSSVFFVGFVDQLPGEDMSALRKELYVQICHYQYFVIVMMIMTASLTMLSKLYVFSFPKTYAFAVEASASRAQERKKLKKMSSDARNRLEYVKWESESHNAEVNTARVNLYNLVLSDDLEKSQKIMMIESAEEQLACTVRATAISKRKVDIAASFYNEAVKEEVDFDNQHQSSDEEMGLAILSVGNRYMLRCLVFAAVATSFMTFVLTSMVACWVLGYKVNVASGVLYQLKGLLFWLVNGFVLTVHCQLAYIALTRN